MQFTITEYTKHLINSAFPGNKEILSLSISYQVYKEIPHLYNIMLSL